MMVAMANELLGLPRGRALTRDDLDSMPDDGHRYELIDGVLIVSPAPQIVHQRVVAHVYRLLHEACPPELEVLFAPLDVVLSDDTVMQPDLVVGRREDFTDRDLPTAPVLAVEVLSPSTRAFDLLVKRDRLQRAGCAHYWVVDPDIPAVIAWRLVDGVFMDAGTATAGEVLQLDDPFDMHLDPSALIVA